MIDQCPFLLEALTWVNNNTFFFLATLQGGMWSSTTLSSCVSSTIWITHRATNGSTPRFHFEASAPSYPFQHALQWDI
jgi:hypothetical protein